MPKHQLAPCQADATFPRRGKADVRAAREVSGAAARAEQRERARTELLEPTQLAVLPADGSA